MQTVNNFTVGIFLDDSNQIHENKVALKMTTLVNKAAAMLTQEKTNPLE